MFKRQKELDEIERSEKTLKKPVKQLMDSDDDKLFFSSEVEETLSEHSASTLTPDIKVESPTFSQDNLSDES